MCTRTVRSYTNARYISAVRPQRFVNYWKCGFCSECIQEKRNEFALRAYYQAKDCISRGGFVLFDTLTYRDSNLKYFSDHYPSAIGQPWNFCSFSRDDVSGFFKNLNTTLTRLGYDLEGNFSHLLTSEYGSRPGCTHRPHYHMLLFVNIPINPVVLSYIIGEVWPYGRTDGAWYKGDDYVRYNRVFRSLDRDLLKVSNYVAKYVGKDLYLHRKLFKRCVRSWYEMHPDWIHDYRQRLEFRRFCNRVLPFHVQSDGFGLSALDLCDRKDIISTDSLPLPLSGPGVVARIPLPLYYRRKLYYSVKLVQGRPRWCLTSFGAKHMVSRFGKSVENLRMKILSYDQHSDAGRFARYHLLRRGLLMDRLTASLPDSELVKYVYSDQVISQFEIDNGLVYFNYSNEDQNYMYGRHITDVERTGVPWFDRCLDRPAGFCLSPREFEMRPPDGLVFQRDPEADAFLDNFFSWLLENGDSIDFVEFKKARQFDRYKQLGFVDEFKLK